MDAITATPTPYTTGSTATSSTASQSSAALDETYDLFLSLLTAQLENQNPTDPMNTDEMTNQLLSYSQIEQQIQTNDYLESLLLSTNEQSSEAALNYIGKDVTYGSASQDYMGTDLSWAVDLPADADAMTYAVVDDAGSTVYQTTQSAAAAGGTFTWDGSTTDGEPAAPGAYSLTATAAYTDGSTGAVTTEARSRATQAVFTSGTPELLLSNGSTIDLDVITSAAEPRRSDA